MKAPGTYFSEMSRYGRAFSPMTMTCCGGTIVSPVRNTNPFASPLSSPLVVHDEVTAALVYAFGGHPNAELRLYFAKQRYKSDVIVNDLELETPILSVNNSNTFKNDVKNLPPPHFVISTTCELDMEKKESVVDPLRHLLHNETTHTCSA